VRIGKELGLPLVATNDAHYVRQSDADAHQLVCCMGFNTTLSEYKSKRAVRDDSYYIKSGAEMWQGLGQGGAQPFENTRPSAERCNLDLQFGRVQLPDFSTVVSPDEQPAPAGHTPSSYLRLVCEEGLMRRFDGHPPEAYVKRLQYELDVIDQTGFPLYMLIVW